MDKEDGWVKMNEKKGNFATCNNMTDLDDITLSEESQRKPNTTGISLTICGI